MVKSRIFCNINFKIGEIDSRVYGSFLEHMGRVIYTGVYEAGTDVSDEECFRTDVLEAVRRMGVKAVRYPGGNFVSTYCWEDGIGPKEKRPRKLDLAWQAIETNEFGTDEFMHWVAKVDAEPIFTINLGTRGIEAALQYLEYCNFPKGTYYSDLRRKLGIEEPYGIKVWCLGNEMDGEWQVGHKTAYEYGRLAAETGKAMKLLDPDIELVVCGSSLSSMPTCPEWDMEVLEQTYDVADYMALHQYYGGQEKGTKFFLAQTIDMEEQIKTLRSVAQIIKRKKKSSRQIKFSVDEWGVWAVTNASVKQEIQEKNWRIAPAISEQIYTLEDALLFAGMYMVILRNADVIKIACQSLLTNVSACIMTQKGGGIWLQTIYYPYFYFSHYAKGTVLQCMASGDTYDCEGFEKVPYVDFLVVWNEREKEIAIFLINKSEKEEMETDIFLQGFECSKIKKSVVMTAEDKKMTNEENHYAVVPKEKEIARLENDHCLVKMEPLSFNMILIE